MHFIILLLFFVSVSLSARFDSAFTQYNLNQNESARNPLDYEGRWGNHEYQQSPTNWRFPFYTIFLDRFVNGDPSNDNINGTVFEQDILSNQFRHGGDIMGLVDSLDYLQGLGIRGLYVAGSPFLNQPWTADSYSPLDLTLLDFHFGTIDDWRNAISEVHKRGMYIILDNTFATLGDLIGFEGYLNSSTPFTLKEHKTLWKSDRRYLDFDISNDYIETCDYPRFWNETGYPIDSTYTDEMIGCYNSEFDQYGDTEAFGVFPDFQRQLSKFSSTQDRLREWKPSVREKLQHFSCLLIQMLDIDGFRFDKATQTTVDAQAEFSDYIRHCAAKVGKKNFFLPGEITGPNTFASIYLGRGRQPDMMSPNTTFSTSMTSESDQKYFIRAKGKTALDAAAFHYSVYRSLIRFLGMDGKLETSFGNSGSWTDVWNTMLLTNDIVNPNTGFFDPRHMFGVTNQDVFRWPAVVNGTERMLLGLFITTIHIPGIPLLTWGEEQSFYVLDNTANNYIYGRQPMSSSLAWQLHGCSHLGSTEDYVLPFDTARIGCKDEGISLDHRDPSHPVHNIVKHMYFLRQQYPVLNDGWFLEQLFNQTRQIQYPGSINKPTETGIWSVKRDFFSTQNVDVTGDRANQSLWLVYHNENDTTSYSFDCSKTESAMMSPFKNGTTVKNLFYPHDEITLTGVITESNNHSGCVDEMVLKGYEFRAYVPRDQFVAPPPLITKMLPGHDARIKSAVPAGSQENVDIEIQFSREMDCDSVTGNIVVSSTTEDLRVAFVKPNSVHCSLLTNTSDITHYVAGIPSVWSWKSTISNVSNGIHSVTVKNVTSTDGIATNSVDRFLFRIGHPDNPMVFPHSANYTRSLIHKGDDNDIFISQKAAGADRWRYSLNWGSSWSRWKDYKGGNNTIIPQPWSGTTRQEWLGTHIIAQYWSKMAGSSSTVQHADLNRDNDPPRRIPHLFAHGPYNKYGFDAGLKDDFKMDKDGIWKFHIMAEWPDSVQLNVWGMNPDGQPDASFVYGDINGDFILDRLPPSSQLKLAINVTEVPPSPYLAYSIHVNDGTLTYSLHAVGSRWVQLALFLLLAFFPIISGTLAVYIYMYGFCSVKFNEVGISENVTIVPLALWTGKRMKHLYNSQRSPSDLGNTLDPTTSHNLFTVPHTDEKRTILIATMEYDIKDWNIMVRVGGLGVMAQLMGKNLEHVNIIWVVPCVGGVDYPPDVTAPPIEITVLGKRYGVQVQYHQLRNITYVLLDAPIFRGQTKTDPYPPRMDDLDSAIYYSAWNQCIAQIIIRFPIDLYHINDYHGAVAPLYLLSRSMTIPCCLSLHNAEFQGHWPMRTPEERKEVCDVFNLEESVVQEYVQFGSTFNLLHAGASYLRLYQKGFGAVGVSKKYGKRSWARHSIFWGLSKIGKLPNPDPTDTDVWNKKPQKQRRIHINPNFEVIRPELKRRAQEWANIAQRTDAELFVFVGRWSRQKGIDLIADIFPSVLEQNDKVQLICVGPVIDLYGRFAALKLGKLMEKYPGRVFSKPEFTVLPPYIFSGAEFTLIPSRDEPFGLVAVEFGRKGALGVGARVGGLGQMPGWWYTVESTTSSHLLKQFREAITEALASNTDTRAMMRAHSAQQRFPVQQWKEDLEKLQIDCIELHHQVVENRTRSRLRFSINSILSIKVKELRTNLRSLPTLPAWALANSRLSSTRSSLDQPRKDPNTENPRTVPVSSIAIDDSGPGPIRLRVVSLGTKQGPGSGCTVENNDEHMIPDNELELMRSREESSEGYPAYINPESYNVSMAPSLTQSLSSENILESQVRIALPSSLSSQKPEKERLSVLSLRAVVGEKKDYSLQKVDLFFTDSTGEYYRNFEMNLAALTGTNSESDLCIEKFLVKSEKTWFNKFHDARLGRSPVQSRRRGLLGRFGESTKLLDKTFADDSMGSADEFLLGPDYKPPKGLKRYMQTKIGDWPVYTILLALGQIMSANSYQITLLTGRVGQSAEDLYATASIYFGASIIWWIFFRRLKPIFVLSSPFIIYGLAIFILGLGPIIPNAIRKFWIQGVATGLYAIASASGSFFFALNFGDEGGAPVKDWIFRACLIQGLQQGYVSVLWYWRSTLESNPTRDTRNVNWALSPHLLTLTTPIALLLWVIGIVLHIGLPDFYRQTPGAVPSFYKAITRRKIVLWTIFTVIAQNYFLSTQYGRSWQFLWSSRAVEGWQIAILFLAFFGVLWAIVLFVFTKLSIKHSWILPIFAIGLGAPRWCQMLWGTSSIGMYLPWAGGPVTSALMSRSLWLWLGLLDTIQGVGFGMILLQTLTRLHVAFTLIAAQHLGSVTTIVARASSPNKLGPGDIFPDFSAGVYFGLIKPWFWVALAFQVLICVGFFKSFRKEQLNKP